MDALVNVLMVILAVALAGACAVWVAWDILRDWMEDDILGLHRHEDDEDLP